MKVSPLFGEVTIQGIGNANSVAVLMKDESGNVLMGSCTTIPSAKAGYAKGCILIKTNVASGARGLYENKGSTSSCDFYPVASTENLLIAPATIATTGNTDGYVIAPSAGKLVSVDFSGVDALAAHDTNYITFSITNLGQAGAGSTAMLAATDANTTKATGGSAIVANGKRALTVHGTAANLVVAAGDRLLVRAAATGTLANTVTFPSYLLRFLATA